LSMETESPGRTMTRLPPLAEGVPGVEEEVVVVPLLQAEAPVMAMVRAARAAKDLRKGTSGEEWVTLSGLNLLLLCQMSITWM
jgi:hypothetical protein